MSPVRYAVLVVEDDPLLRMHAMDVVHDAGCIPVEAKNADEAIEILQARSDITVLFTDVQMPGSMDGVKLAHFVRERWPPVKIIVTSGFKHVTPDQLPSGSVFLGKPYLPDQLTRHIRSLVDA